MEGVKMSKKCPKCELENRGWIGEWVAVFWKERANAETLDKEGIIPSPRVSLGLVSDITDEFLVLSNHFWWVTPERDGFDTFKIDKNQVLEIKSLVELSISSDHSCEMYFPTEGIQKEFEAVVRSSSPMAK
jgi:hypothetical protein